MLIGMIFARCKLTRYSGKTNSRVHLYAYRILNEMG